MVFNRATINGIPSTIRLPPNNENKIHRWAFYARNLTSSLNRCQPSDFFFPLQFQNFFPKFNRQNKPHFACPHRVCQSCKFQKERKLFAFFTSHVQAKKRDLGKIKVASRRQKRYSSTKKLDEHDESSKRGTISAET